MEVIMDKIMKIVLAVGYMLAIIMAMFIFIIAIWVIGGWVV